MANNFISLNGIELTDQGRLMTEGFDPRIVENDLANGNKVRYVKALKKTWNLDWEWLPDDATQTYDGNGARDVVKSLAFSLTSMPLVIHGLASDQTFDVLVKDYHEDVVRRDYTDNIIFYKVSLQLIEV